MASLDAATTDALPALQPGARHAAFVLPAEGGAVREARRLVGEHLTSWGVGATARDTAALLMSELFTNAVVHTDSRVIRCRVEATRERLLIQVADEGGGPSAPTPQRADFDDESGRGLLIVKSESERWGVSRPRGGDGRVVWATLRTSPS
ncbi:ATP-binding protein [Streptomyces sp. NPDC004752]